MITSNVCIMLESCIYNILDCILPNTDKSKHDIPRLEYLGACNISENKKDIMEILQFLPACLYKSLVQSVIHNCYLQFIYSLDISRPDYFNFLQEIEVQFPETLGILVLNWPFEEFILRNQIPSLEPTVDIFPSHTYPLASQRQAIGQVYDMLRVFNIFCESLIQFITQTVFNCTPANTQLVSYNLRKLDLSGLGDITPLLSDNILEGISNSTTDTFGHKVEIYVDAGTMNIAASNKIFKLLRKIVEQSLKPDKGISIYYKTISYYSGIVSLPNDLVNVFTPGRCEYIMLRGFIIGQHFAKNLCIYIPGLVGINLQYPPRNTNIEFLSSFQYLEQLVIKCFKHKSLTNVICNMSKGLKYLSLETCSLKRQDFECLATSIHLDTLKQLDIKDNRITNDSEAVGLITVCQNFKNVKVLIVEQCSLETLSLNTVSKLINTLRNCDQLEFLSMRGNPFNLEITNMIIDGLAHNNSLRYLSLDLPDMPRLVNYYEHMEYQQNLCKTSHDKINECRHSPFYISWI